MSKKFYCIHLSGQGDDYFYLVEKETWDYLHRAGGVLDNDLALCLQSAHEEVDKYYEQDFPDTPDFVRYEKFFWSLTALTNYLHDNDLTLIATSSGYVY